MGSASKCFLSLILIFLTFVLFKSQLLSISSSNNPNSNNVISKVRILPRLRFLLDLKKPITFRRKTHNFSAFSPSPAPSQEVRKPFVANIHHANQTSNTRTLSNHQSFYNEKSATKNGKKKISTIVVFVCVSLVISVIIFAIFSLLLCKKSKGKNKKANFDPGPELFYLNSLTHYIDIHDSNLVKNSSDPSNVSSSFVLTSFRNGDNTCCSDDETQSFHSAQASDLSELPQNHMHSSLSPPYSSYYQSVSPFGVTLGKPCISSNVDKISHAASKSIDVNDSHEFRFPAISPPRISFLDYTKKPFPSKNSPIPESTTESHFPIDSLGGHFQATSPSLGLSFPKNVSAALSRNNASKSQDSSKSQVVNDSSRNRKLDSKVTSESQYSLEYEVLSDFPQIHLPALTSPRSSFIPSTKNSFPQTNYLSTNKTCISSQSCAGISSVSSIIMGCAPSSLSTGTNIVQSPIISLSKNENIPKPPPPPPPPPPQPIKKLSNQKPCNNEQNISVPPSPLKNLEVVGQDESTLPKLKPLHWDKVKAAPDRSMVWDKIRSSSFEFDEEMIGSLFGYKSKSVLVNEETKSKTSSPSKNVLEHKRLQNIKILLKALSATPELVCDSLTKGSGLSVEQLEALAKMTPTKEELENLSKYIGDIEELDPAEKFVKMLLVIPFAFAKIEMMLYKGTFEDEVSHIRSSFATLELACRELKSSKLFLRLLKAVLKTGNRMNVGTTRGDAKAFKLDALLKLADVKGTDGKTTLLHFVIQEMNKPKIEDSEHNKTINKELTGLDLVSGLSSELSNVKKTASLDLEVLIGSIENLSLGFSKLKQLVQNDLCFDDQSLSFLQSMRVFMQNTERNMKELKNEKNEVLMHVREITEYYHGDLSNEETNPLRIFVIVRDFLAMLDRVCKELWKPKTNQTGPRLVILSR